jgi:hypothetical protein
VVELGDGVRLGLEAPERGRVLGQVGLEELERDGPLEGELPGEVDLPHAAGAELADDLEPAEGAAGEVGGLAGVGGVGRQGRVGRGIRHRFRLRRRGHLTPAAGKGE